MADRSVVVRLRADIAQYQASMKRAKDATTEFGREVSGTGKTARADVEALGRTALIAGGVIAVGLGKGLQVAMGFEKQMSGVRAVSGASADEMNRLSDAAVAAGANTKLAGVTASDAARAEAELVKAGVSVSDVLGGALTGSLTLAAAGQLDFADAATIAAQAMNIFDLKGGAVSHVADVLAAAANKSASDVGGLGDALRQGGLVAAQTGLSLEETVGALAAFADNALIGSDAGTSLKTMLQRLTPISKESASLMDEIGFSAYDLQGNFIGLEGLADELQTSMAGMTVEQRNLTLAQLFGSDAVRGANVLYEEGAEGVKEYTDAVNDQGAAARMAAIQNDNLAGDVEALGGALESALIENGSKATGALRFLTQGATDMVTGFSQMPDLMQTSALGISAVAAGGTLAIGVLGTLAPKFTQAKTALEGMGTVGPKIANNLGKITGALGVLGAGLGVFATFQSAMGAAAASGQEFADSMAPKLMDFSTYDELVDKVHTVDEELGNLVEDANNTNNPFDRAEILAAADAMEVTATKISNIRGLAQELAPELGVTKDAMVEFLLAQDASGVDLVSGSFGDLKTSMRDAYGQMPAITSGIADVGEAMGMTEESTKAAEEAFKGLMDAYRGAVDPLFGVLDALEGNRDAQDALTAAYAANADGVADNDVSMRDLADLQADVASSALDAMSASQELAHAIDTGKVSVDEAKNMLQEWVDKGLIAQTTADEMAGRFGWAADEADRLAGDYVVTVETSGAQQAINALIWQMAILDNAARSYGMNPLTFGGGSIAARDHVIAGSTGGRVSAGGIDPLYRAGGGPVGTDTVPAWLTPGEYVVNAGTAQQLGYGYLDQLNSGNLSAATGMGGGSMDNSRHTTFQVQPTIYEATSPRETASEVIFEARVLAAGMT